MLVAKTSYRPADRVTALDPALLWRLPKPSEMNDGRKLSRPTGAVDGRKTKVRRGLLPTELFKILAAHGETAVPKEHVEPIVLALRHRDDVLVRVVLPVRVNMMGRLPMLQETPEETLCNHTVEQPPIA
jgi:hypothetical protein